MTNEQFEKWVAALNSGNYTQAHMTLVDNCQEPTKFCCLGLYSYINGCDLDEEQREMGYTITYPKASEFDRELQGLFAGFNDRDQMNFSKIAGKARQLRKFLVTEEV